MTLSFLLKSTERRSSIRHSNDLNGVPPVPSGGLLPILANEQISAAASPDEFRSLAVAERPGSSYWGRSVVLS